MTRPPIPPDQLAGRINRAKSDVEKAAKARAKAWDRWAAGGYDDKGLENFLRAEDRYFELDEELTRLELMKQQWIELLEADTTTLGAERDELHRKLSKMDEKLDRMRMQRHALLWG